MVPNVEVRGAPQANAPVVEKLGMHFVRVMPDEAAGNQQPPMLRVVTPNGKVGFVSAEAIEPGRRDQICYVKDATGWKITGLVGGGETAAGKLHLKLRLKKNDGARAGIGARLSMFIGLARIAASRAVDAAPNAANSGPQARRATMISRILLKSACAALLTAAFAERRCGAATPADRGHQGRRYRWRLHLAQRRRYGRCSSSPRTA